MSRLALPTLPNGSIFIGSVSPNGDVSFAARPKIHRDLKTAEGEVVRLAASSPGKEFVIVQVQRSAVLPTQQVVLS